jgi:hypothetical protein
LRHEGLEAEADPSPPFAERLATGFGMTASREGQGKNGDALFMAWWSRGGGVGGLRGRSACRWWLGWVGGRRPGGGETVGVGEFVAGVECGGLLGEVVGGGDQVDEELGDFGDDFLGVGGALGRILGTRDKSRSLTPVRRKAGDRVRDDSIAGRAREERRCFFYGLVVQRRRSWWVRGRSACRWWLGWVGGRRLGRRRSWRLRGVCGGRGCGGLFGEVVGGGDGVGGVGRLRVGKGGIVGREAEADPSPPFAERLATGFGMTGGGTAKAAMTGPRLLGDLGRIFYLVALYYITLLFTLRLTCLLALFGF